MDKLTLTNADFERAARRLRCSVAAIMAVAEVESRGKGFYSDGLGDVTPQFTRHDIFYRLTTQMKAFCKTQPLFSLFSQTPDFFNVITCQFRSPVLLASLIHQSQMMLRSAIRVALAVSIPVVVEMCAEKQMGWIDTFPVIARMADKKIAWIQASMKKIRDAMGSPRRVAIPKSSIAIKDGGLPFPTTIGLFHESPKPSYVVG